MRLGILSDLHIGYRRGYKTLPDGTNMRENDIAISACIAVKNLLNANVDSILDLGDIAHIPHPGKRAILTLISLINDTGRDWYSVNGNHTLQRTNSDAHLYELLEAQCPRFKGVMAPEALYPIGVYAVPYAPSEAVVDALAETPPDVLAVAGHWACDDADWPGEHVPAAALPKDRPTFLGHWHTRSRGEIEVGRPIYIGATDRLSWGEANNPTGCAVWDTSDDSLTWIDHETRPWVDILVDSENYLEDEHYAQIQDSICRVRIASTSEQYHSVDMVRLRKKLAPALEHQILRLGSGGDADTVNAYSGNLSIRDNWQQYIRNARIPRGVKRRDVEQYGLEALE